MDKEIELIGRGGMTSFYECFIKLFRLKEIRLKHTNKILTKKRKKNERNKRVKQFFDSKFLNLIDWLIK